MAEEEDAPPAVPEWEPSELAKRIASGHARVHFADLDADELSRLVQLVMDIGEAKQFGRRTLYWDQALQVAMVTNPRDVDGGSVFESDQRYIDKWGR